MIDQNILMQIAKEVQEYNTCENRSDILFRHVAERLNLSAFTYNKELSKMVDCLSAKNVLRVGKKL